jgi:xanthosine utilization system XapX-like protein
LGKLNKKHYSFFSFFCIILFFNALGHIKNSGVNGIYLFLQTISGYYIIVFLGWALYKIYLETGNEYRLLKFVVRIGGFIALVNIFHFVLLQTDNYIYNGGYTIEFNRYTFITDYVIELNKYYFDYIILSAKYNDVGFIRHVGYFYDTHSQFYFPMAAGIILLLNKNITRYRWIYFPLLFLSLIFSGIKTAYIIIVLLIIIYLLVNDSFLKTLKILFLPLTAAIIVFRKKILHILLGEQLIKIIIQLANHLILVPIAFFSSNIISFFIGGAPDFRNDTRFYSEIFWVTVIFYIGIIGIYIYLKPIKLIKFIKNPEIKIGSYLYLLFCLSMAHYGVYCIGINNLVSAIPFMYYFKITNKGNIE